MMIAANRHVEPWVIGSFAFIDQPEFPATTGNVVPGRTWEVHNLEYSSLLEYMMNPTCTLYLRDSYYRAMESIREVFNIFRDNFESIHRVLPNVDISGPSGCGKSTMMFGVFCSATFQNKLWITSFKGMTFDIVHFCGDDNNTNQYTRYRKVPNDKLGLFIDLLPTSVKGAVSLLVLDGSFGESNPIDIHNLDILLKKLCLVRCASGSSSLYITAVCHLRPKIISMPSFTVAEYAAAREALRQVDPLLADRTDEKLSEFYYIVGGNSRAFFNSTDLQEATNAMDGHLYQTNRHTRKELLTGTADPGGIGSVINNLLSFVEVDGRIKYTVVSRYVLEKLLVADGLSAVREARNLLPDNPSYQGWVLEGHLIATAKISEERGVPFVLYSRGLIYGHLSIPKLKVCYIADHTQIPVYGYEKEDAYTLFVPRRWYNDAYDAMLVHTCGTTVSVRILQATVSSSHSCNLQNCGDFIKRMFDVNSGTAGTQQWRNPKTAQGMPEGYTQPPYVLPIGDQHSNKCREIGEVAVRGLRSKIAYLSRMVNHPRSLDAPLLKIRVDYCIVTTAENLNSFTHDTPVQNADIIQRHDPTFAHPASFKTYYCKDE